MRVRVTAATHHGAVRTENQDAVVVGTWVAQGSGTAETRLVEVETTPVTVAVLDGMGGHAGGAIASLVGANALGLETSSLPTPHEEGDARALLERVDARVAAVAQGSLADMGATVVAVVMTHEVLDVVSAGDCRAYRLDPPYLGQLTVDDRVEAPGEPGRMLVSESLGGRRPVQSSVLRLDARTPQVLLLCSDGLHDVVDDVTLADQFLEGVDGPSIIQALLRTALRAGAPDNVSVVLVETHPDLTDAPEAEPGAGHVVEAAWGG